MGISKGKGSRSIIIIAILVLVIGALAYLFRNQIFADTATTDPPQFTSFSTGAGNGTYKVTFAGLTNFEPSEMYIWFDCPTALTTDTKATLISKCGTPNETGSFNDVFPPGVKVRTFSRGGGFKVTFPTTPLPSEKTAVAYAASSAIPNGVVKTYKYTPRIQRLDPYPGTNFSMTVGYTELGIRFRVEKLDQANGQILNRKYTFWYDCPNAGDIPVNATVAELTQRCGTPNVSTSRPTDRYHIYRNNIPNGARTFVAAVEEMTCSGGFTSSGCTWPGTTIFAGKKTYTATDPTTTLSTYPTNGNNRMVFRVNSSRTIDEAYVWWDCAIQPQDDTKEELISRCGIPHERINLGSATEQYQGDIRNGARVQVSGSAAAYLVTLPQKTNAQAVAYVASTMLPNGKAVATRYYSTQENRSVTPYGNTNFAISIDEVVQGTRYIVERLNAQDGSLPQSRYWTWYNCSRTSMPGDTKYTTIESSCGPANYSPATPGRLHHVNTNPTPSSTDSNFFVIAQEKQCTNFTYKTDNTNCQYSSNAFVGNKTYKVSDYIGYTLMPGFNAVGMNVATSAGKFESDGLFLLKYTGSWIQYPDRKNNTPLFWTEPLKGYYVYNPSQESLPIKLTNDSSVQTASTPFPLSQNGWNMLWTGIDVNYSDLKFTHNGAVKTVTELISSGTIDSRIFIIDNETTSTCQYYKLLGSAESTTVNCSSDPVQYAITTKIPAKKAFWVKVK